MPLTIVRQDITKLRVDAIVNTANTGLQMGGGVCGAIFSAAGAAQLQAACDKLAPIKTGEAVITPGFNLPAKYIIHTAGPIYAHWSKEENGRYLRLAYINSLRIALENKCQSIAFPLISSGIYGYPRDEALNIATSAIKEFLHDHDMDIILAVFDKSTFAVSQELLGEVESYIDDYYVDTHQIRRERQSNVKHEDLYEVEDCISNYSRPLFEDMIDLRMDAPAPLDDLVGNLDESFSQMLLRLIDAKGMSDVEIYRRANLDRKLFSKIRSGKGYMPSKRTAIALALALELSLDETDDLLKRAGYALSRAVKFDVIVEYFIISRKYDVFKINEVLFEYDQPLLGG